MQRARPHRLGCLDQKSPLTPKHSTIMSMMSRSSDDNMKLAIEVDKTDFHAYPTVGVNYYGLCQ
jgi:hypothetical protein